MIEPNINITENYVGFCEKVTEEILALSNRNLSRQERFTVVLSGGTTPKGIYECMSSPSYREKFQWEKIHFFWSDERWVPPEDPKSNLRMVSEAFLTKIRIPSGNIHSIPTNKDDIKNSARRYEEMISDFFRLRKGDFPRFDLILLGLGQDGHTASLFPGNPALLIKDRLAIATSQKGIAEERITLTLPVINHAHTVFFLVSGQEKADIVHEVLEDENKDILPAKQINPPQGELYWFLDKNAASKLVLMPDTRNCSEK